MIHLEHVKHVGELTADDFRQYPVWSWYDDDASLVMPIEVTGSLPDDDYLAFFIFCEIVLSDGTKMEGEVAVSLNSKSVYGLAFFRGNERFDFVGSLAPPYGTLGQLAEWLHKSVDEITPVKYLTPFSFADGTPIIGEIDLRKW